MSDFLRDSDAPFNMALATLMRLDKILQQVNQLSYIFPQDCLEKQKMHLELVKNFFLNSIPILKEADVKVLEENILNIDIKKQFHIRGGIQKFSGVYDKELEIKLNKLLIEIQDKSRKFYMPKGKDPGNAVSFS